MTGGGLCPNIGMKTQSVSKLLLLLWIPLSVYLNLTPFGWPSLTQSFSDRDQLWTQRSVTSMRNIYHFYIGSSFHFWCQQRGVRDREDLRTVEGPGRTNCHGARVCSWRPWPYLVKFWHSDWPCPRSTFSLPCMYAFSLIVWRHVVVRSIRTSKYGEAH